MSDRGASAAFKAELALAKNQPIHLVQVALDSGTTYVTDAYKTIAYGGHDYLALGHLLGFSDIEESVQLQVSNLTLSLSGVDQSYIALFLGEAYIDRTVKIYKALLDVDDDSLVANPVLFFEGRMDQPVIQEDPDNGTCVLGVSCTNAWVDFERRPGRHTNHLEQQVHFPGDMGFEFASEVPKDLIWGRKS